MTTTPVPLFLDKNRRPWLRQTLGRAWAFSPILTFSALAHLALIPLFAAAAIADPRVITGAPAWVKPLKFAISITIYTGTFVWLLTFVQGHRRLVRWVAAITGIGLGVEMALIALQVLRGTTSHFNISTAFDAAVFSIMGAMITSGGAAQPAARHLAGPPADARPGVCLGAAPGGADLLCRHDGRLPDDLPHRGPAGRRAGRPAADCGRCTQRECPRRRTGPALPGLEHDRR